MRQVTLALLILASAQISSAQETKTYEQSPKQVFAAALSVAKAHYAIESVDDKNEIINLHTGHSLTSNGFYVTVAVDGNPLGCSEKCKGSVVTIRETKAHQLFAWGAGGRIAKQFFKQTSEVLAGESKH